MAEPKLTKLELQIMETLWTRGQVSIREIQAERRSAELFFSEKNYSAVRLPMRVRGSAGNHPRSTSKPLGVTGASVRLPG